MVNCFYCFVIVGLFFNCFSCGEDFPNRFNLNIVNPTILTKQEDYEASVRTKSQQFCKGFDPNFNNSSHQTFEALVSTKNNQEFPKDLDPNFNNPISEQQALGAVSPKIQEFSKGFDPNFKNPTEQPYEASVSTRSQQFSKGLDPKFNNPTQQSFGTVISKNIQEFFKVFHPNFNNSEHQDFGAVIPKNIQEFSKGFDPNFNNSEQQDFGAGIIKSIKNSEQLYKGFDPNFNNNSIQQAFGAVSPRNTEQFSKGFVPNFNNPTQKAFQALNAINIPQLCNSFDSNTNNGPTRQALRAVITTQLTNGFNFRNPLSPFQQGYRDPNTNQHISSPLVYVRDPLLPPLFSNEKQLSRNDDTQNNLKQRHDTLAGNGNYNTIAETRGKRLEGEQGICGKAAGTLIRDGGECVVNGDNGRLLWELREPESFSQLQQKQRLNFPLQFQAPIKFRSNIFNDNAGIDHYNIQNMASVPNSKKDLFDLTNNNKGYFDEFRNVYNGGIQTHPEIAYNSLMNEYDQKIPYNNNMEENIHHVTQNVGNMNEIMIGYDQKVSNIPNNMQENIPHVTQNVGKMKEMIDYSQKETPHITHNADKIGILNDIMSEYNQILSTIPSNMQKDTPHMTHNVDKIARLNQMIDLELNGEAKIDINTANYNEHDEVITSLNNGVEHNSNEFPSEYMTSSTTNESGIKSTSTGTIRPKSVTEGIIKENTFGGEVVEKTVQEELGHGNSNFIDEFSNETEVLDNREDKQNKNLKNLKQTSKQSKNYDTHRGNPLKHKEEYYKGVSQSQYMNKSHNQKNHPKSRSKPKVTTRNPEECIRKIKELLQSIEPSTIHQKRREEIRKRKRDRNEIGIASPQTIRKTNKDNHRILVRDQMETKTWGSIKDLKPSNNMSALSFERKYSKIDVKFNKDDKPIIKDKTPHKENSKTPNKRKQHIIKDDVMRQCKCATKEKDGKDECEKKGKDVGKNENDRLKKFLECNEDEDNEMETYDEDDYEEEEEDSEEEDDDDVDDDDDDDGDDDDDDGDDDDDDDDFSDQIEDKREESILTRLSDKFDTMCDSINLDGLKSNPELIILGIISILVFILIVIFILIRLCITSKQNPFETGGFTVVRLNVQPRRHDNMDKDNKPDIKCPNMKCPDMKCPDMKCPDQNHDQFGQQVYNCQQCQDNYQSTMESGSTVLKALYLPEKNMFSRLSEASMYCTINPELRENEIMSSRKIIHGKRINKSSTDLQKKN